MGWSKAGSFPGKGELMNNRKDFDARKPELRAP